MTLGMFLLAFTIINKGFFIMLLKKACDIHVP